MDTDETPVTKRPRGGDVVSPLDGDARGPPPKQAREDELREDTGAAAGPAPSPAATDVVVPPTSTRTADDIKAALARAEKGLERALANEDENKAIANDQNRTPEERRNARQALLLAAQIIKINTERVTSLENDLRIMSAAQPPPQQPAPPVFETLEELILAMGGKRENGTLQLNMLTRARGSLTTDFRGRTIELRLFAEYIQAYKRSASSDRAEHHPYFVATALPGTGKTTFGLEAFAHLPVFLAGDDTAGIIRNGVTIYLNLNGGEASWRITDKELNAEARLVARIVATVFLESGYQPIWTKFQGLLRANVQLLSFRPLATLIAAAQRTKLGMGHDVKVSALFVLDEFQHLDGDLNDVLRPILTTMGDTQSHSTCFKSDGILVVPLLAGTSLEGAKAVEVLSGHKRKIISLGPFSDVDLFAILCDVMKCLNPFLPKELLDYFAPALDVNQPMEALSTRQLTFRGLVLDCGGNPSLLVHLARQLGGYCKGRFDADSNDFLDGLFAAFASTSSLWHSEIIGLRQKIGNLPASLVPIVVASIPIELDQPAVDDKGGAMTQTWSQLFSSCGLTPIPHPSFRDCWMIQIPYVYLNILAAKDSVVSLHACTDFPYLYRSGQGFENLVFKVHVQRIFHLLGASALSRAHVQFQQLFPGGFVPSALGECQVRLPDETATRQGGPRYVSESEWCHRGGAVDDIPPTALSGDVCNISDINHYHFDGRSALLVKYAAYFESFTSTLLLWQIKLSQPGSKTTFGLADIRAWHATARTLTKRWTDTGTKVVFVLVLFRQLSAATIAKNAEVVCEEVRQYAQASGDLVVVTKEHMGEYLAGLAHRLYVPLESTSSATA
jgi:hypothetical protein